MLPDGHCTPFTDQTLGNSLSAAQAVSRTGVGTRMFSLRARVVSTMWRLVCVSVTCVSGLHGTCRSGHPRALASPPTLPRPAPPAGIRWEGQGLHRHPGPYAQHCVRLLGDGVAGGDVPHRHADAAPRGQGGRRLRRSPWRTQTDRLHPCLQHTPAGAAAGRGLPWELRTPVSS